jgi:quercetin dioxygenase-like cupin family protein
MDNLFRRQVHASYFEFGLVNLLFNRGSEKQFGGIMQTAEIDSRSTKAYRDVRVAETQVPGLDLDISHEIEQLYHCGKWQNGTSRKQLIRFSDFHISLTAMKADARIGLHMNSGRISVQTVEGHIRMHAGSQTFDLPKGRVLVLDRSVPHDVEALTDSAFLLTVAQPEEVQSKG